MARIRPAKSQSETGTGKKVTPPDAPPPGRRRPASTPTQERKAARVRPAQRQGVQKTGTVTKAVQVNRASRFLSEVVAELRKVSWPTRPALLQSTAVVIVCVAVVAAYLGVLDAAFERIVDAIF